jgi:hypothetical protein
VNGQTHHEADPEAPVQGPLPVSRPPTMIRFSPTQASSASRSRSPRPRTACHWASSSADGRGAPSAPGSPVMVEPPGSQFNTALLRQALGTGLNNRQQGRPPLAPSSLAS